MTTVPAERGRRLASCEVIFMVAKNGYGTEPSLRFSTYEEAEKKFIEYLRDGYTNVVIIEKRCLSRLMHRPHRAIEKYDILN